MVTTKKIAKKHTEKEIRGNQKYTLKILNINKK